MSAGLEELLGGRFTVERNISYLVQVKSLILLVMVVGHLSLHQLGRVGHIHNSKSYKAQKGYP